MRDPRLFQITVLSALLAWGVARLGLPVDAGRLAVLALAAFGTQWLGSRWVGIRFEARSALISVLSLALLARSGSLAPLALAAVLAVASKFLIRRRGKHVFNPTNFGLVAAALLTDGLWVSPGLWGSGATLAFLVACAGFLVVRRAARSDVTWAFLIAYAAMLFGRAAWLGDPWRIPLHTLESGALLIFAFFMISDPKTTPDSRPGRLVWAVLIAAGACFVQFGLYRPNGFLWSLFCAAPLVPWIDQLLPGRRYRWPGDRLAPPAAVSPPTLQGGPRHESPLLETAA